MWLLHYKTTLQQHSLSSQNDFKDQKKNISNTLFLSCHTSILVWIYTLAWMSRNSLPEKGIHIAPGVHIVKQVYKVTFLAKLHKCFYDLLCGMSVYSDFTFNVTKRLSSGIYFIFSNFLKKILCVFDMWGYFLNYEVKVVINIVWNICSI